MREAIATAEIFVHPSDGSGAGVRRLTLVVGAPERADEEAEVAWRCRVALADLHRPEILHGPDSLVALQRALDRARGWLAALESSGHRLSRDREGAEPFRLA